MPRDALFLVILILLMGFAHEREQNLLLREQVVLLKQLRQAELEMCAGTFQVNQLRERTIRELMQRLRVDPNNLSSLSYAIIRRVMTPSAVIVHGKGGADEEPIE